MTQIVDFKARLAEKMRQSEKQSDRILAAWDRQKAMVAPIEQMRASGHRDMEIAQTLRFLADVLEGKDSA